MKKESLGNIKFSNIMSGLALDSEGVSGGLLISYNNKHFRFEPKYNDGNILFCRVYHMHSNESWFLLNILYAPNNKRERKIYWSKVGELV